MRSIDVGRVAWLAHRRAKERGAHGHTRLERQGHVERRLTGRAEREPAALDGGAHRRQPRLLPLGGRQVGSGRHEKPAVALEACGPEACGGHGQRARRRTPLRTRLQARLCRGVRQRSRVVARLHALPRMHMQVLDDLEQLQGLVVLPGVLHVGMMRAREGGFSRG